MEELQVVQEIEIEPTLSVETIPDRKPEQVKDGIDAQAAANSEDGGKTNRPNKKNEKPQEDAKQTGGETSPKTREDESEHSRRKRRGRSYLSLSEVEVEPTATTGNQDEHAQPQTEYHQVSTIRDIEDIEYDELSDTTADEDIANGSDIDVVRDTLRSICEDASDDDGWIHAANLAEILSRRLTDFDYRNFGFKKFVPFVESLKMFESKSIKADGAPGRAVYFCLLEDWTK
ncbi:MAG: OST-HTH/LOTUS domain-containing protein [Coriobacteriia bacterium]|nr:OST-HTH/LOTUS domain-containing protein [Coriobacteriia bacterium]